ncbi:uncharacterized protein AMSG_01781 [Thecamonas trahens ATCC 50062]|uniref:Uncharacterized protein n=1 Tax=Thecamonas trahens ATCC 50062 TaxID=461836 RepID=A0A0L0DTZ0_THETB|nr:hypothetical protein AMSG_01781 [Thecamonas trahens ATCC 50062]KNC55516.1 hypothetical protein AMSG_01781 [Thecamonas trahens ATCC 50062]|eukprot:XP_013761294.1 hypothetical protein AMSG_01781 [Thecamonas trahens ATCC 50062]
MALLEAIRANDGEALAAMVAGGVEGLNEAGDGGLTPLTLAVVTGNAGAVAALLALEELDPNVVTPKGFTALMLAVDVGDPALYGPLLADARVDPAVRGREGMTPLMAAAARNRDGAVVALLATDRAEPEAADDAGWTAVHAAAAQGAVEALGVLASEGIVAATATVCDSSGCTPLMYACIRGEPRTVSVLLDAAAEAVNLPGASGKTPLLEAVERGHVGLVPALLAAGADAAASNAKGITALHLAAANNLVEVVSLLATPATINVVDNSQRTAMFLAAGLGNAASVRVLAEVDGVDVLIPGPRETNAVHMAAEAGAAIDALIAVTPGALHIGNEDGMLPIHFAVRGTQTATLRWLLEQEGAEPAATDAEGWTILHMAAASGVMDVLEMLTTGDLAGVVPLNAVTIHGDTPLHKAARYGQADAARLLAGVPGVDFDALDCDGLTPRQAAAAAGHEEVAALCVPCQVPECAPPTPVMEAAFEERTVAHIAAVARNLDLISQTLPDLAEDLRLRADVHDASKWDEPERTPYVWLTAWYAAAARDEPLEYPAGVAAAVAAAITHHKACNRHHVEFHGAAGFAGMSDLDLAEMVADWAAIAQEQSGETTTSPREWFEASGRDKWDVSDADAARILSFIDALEVAISSSLSS